MSSENKTFSVYAYLENCKNTVYRNVSSAREKGLFWPSYAYSFFYSNEKVIYNTLLNRQKLAEITPEEVNEYNEIRKSILPVSSYRIALKTSKTHEGENFSEACLVRKDYYLRQCFAVGLFAHFYLQLTRFWIVGAFAPAVALKCMDYSVTSDEVNNFYRFLVERQEANRLFKESEGLVSSRINKEKSELIAVELNRANKSLEEAISDLHTAYLNAALENKL